MLVILRGEMVNPGDYLIALLSQSLIHPRGIFFDIHNALRWLNFLYNTSKTGLLSRSLSLIRSTSTEWVLIAAKYSKIFLDASN